MGQDTLKVMSYNLLNFPDGRDDCGSNLQVGARWDTLRKIVQYAKPDILMVCELQNEAGADSILNNALNVNNINYYSRANFVTNQSPGGSSLNNMFFYNSQKVTLYSQSEVTTDLRDIGAYVVYANDPNLSFYNDTTFMFFFVGHLKAGNWNAPIEKNRRAAECNSLRTYIDALAVGSNIIFGGDFNFYTSTEPGYQILTTGGVNKLNDPINSPGNWNNNSAFKSIHTQSTRSSNYIECGAVGGMDDRFDFILLSDSMLAGGNRVQYINNSYKAFGNDGIGFNQAINAPSNPSLPDSIMEALYYMSDHLPVILDLNISYPNTLGSTITVNNISCNGACDGSATITPIGGTLPHTYQWNDPGLQTSSTATGLCAGTYIVTLSDNNGIVLVDSITISEPTPFLATFSDSSIIACNGDSTGSATVLASGGTSPYTYAWNDPSGQTNASAFGLAAGTYTVSVTDNNNCLDTAIISIIESSSTPMFASITTTTNILCSGNNTGQAIVSTTGGTPPYTFLWNDLGSQTDSIASGLIAGTYAVQVSDSAGCSILDTTTITEPLQMLLNVIDTGSASCDTANSTASISVSGGVLPYTYLWSDPTSQTTAIATGLASGSYTIIVVDANGCVDSAYATISDNQAPTVTITDSTNVLCFGATNGSATITPIGGSPPYTYSWSPGTSTDSTAQFLPAGTYFATVIDAAGCKTVKSVTITEPPQLISDNIDSSNVICSGDSNGTITAQVFGGVAPYTYLWSNGDTDSLAENLGPGIYSVLVTDANGCIANDTMTPSSCFEIESILVEACKQPGEPEGYNEMVRMHIGYNNLNTADIVVNWPNNAWKGICQNTITSNTIDSINSTITGGGQVIEPTGGLLPAGAQVMLITSIYFDWTSHDWSGLDYTLYLIFQCDSNKNGHFKNYCSTPCGTRTLEINFGLNCGDTVTYEPNLLPLGADGDGADFDVAGNPTYNNSGCVPPYITPYVPPSVTISEPPILNTSIIDSSDQQCSGDSAGFATIQASGGVTPYSYLWNDGSGQTDSVATGLMPGTYSAIITDNNGCMDSLSVTINSPSSPLTASMVDSSYIICNGQNTGSAEVSASGGTPPLTYLWNDPSLQIGTVASSLIAGNYTIQVTDANGCVDSASVSILEPPPIIINITSVKDADCGLFNGEAITTISGGVSPYTYLWNDPMSQTDTIANALGAGTYTLVVTDSNNCVDSLSIDINDMPGPGISIVNSTSIQCNGDSSSIFSLPGGGQPPYTYLWDDINTQTDSNATGLPAGTYTVMVTDFYGCTGSDSITITQPTALTMSATNIDAGCGLLNGSSSIIVSGGTLTYSYLWNTSPAQTTASATGLGAGSYTLTVTDGNACVDSITTTISNLGGPSILISDSTNILCNGNSTGSATVSVTGGTAPFTYLWNDGSAQTNSIATGLLAGTYTVTVTDNANCNSLISVTLTEPNPFSLSFSSNAVSCNGDANGSSTITVSGGVSPYSYNWNDSNNQTDSIATGLSAGTYTITITDANNCTLIANDTITEPTSLALSMNTSPENCGNNDGTATISVSGGTPSFSYSWSTQPIQTNASATGLAPGSYLVIVNDANACADSLTATISTSAGPIITTDSITNISCNAGDDGIVDISISGGTPLYTYLWSNGAVSEDIQNLSAGSYTITVTDSSNCMDSATFILSDPPALSLVFSSTDESCGNNNGTITAIVSNGTMPYSYSWNDPLSQTSAIATGLSAGSYSVSVTDSSGCFTSSSWPISIIEGPIIDSIIIVNESCPGMDDGTLLVVVNGGTTPYTYTWDGPVTSTIANPTTLPSGEYSLLITDSLGCIAFDSAAILVLKPSCSDSLIIPNSFTPNNDGKNDSWSFGGIDNYPEIIVEIYNRWGSLLFTSKGYNEPWDGTYEGEPVAIATYYYIILLDDQEDAIKGSVTIVR